MGSAGVGLVLGDLFVVGRWCLPWWCRVVCRYACWRMVLGMCPAWPACGALLARACCCAAAGTHPLSGGPVWLHGGPCWRPAVARCVAVGCVYVGGGCLAPLPSPLPPCPSVSFRRPALPAYPPSSYPLGWPWLDGWSWWSDMVFLPCRAAWAGFVVGADCSCGVPCRVYGVVGLLAPIHRYARSVCGVACAVSWAAWLLFTGVHALCVVLRVRCPGLFGSCSPMCALCLWCCVYGVLGLLAPVHGVHALCVVLGVRCPGPPGSCSPVCTLCVWCCVYGVLGLLAPVHRCARSVCGVACAVSWASWLLFTVVHALCVVLRVRCPGPLGSCLPLCMRCRAAPCAQCPGPPGSCSPLCTLCVWCCVYGVLGLLAPVHRCARSVCGVAAAMSWAAWPLFTAVHALCVVLRVQCPGPLGSCSPMCTLCVR